MCLESSSAAIFCKGSERTCTSSQPLRSNLCEVRLHRAMAAQSVCSMAPALASSRTLPTRTASRSGEFDADTRCRCVNQSFCFSTQEVRTWC